MLKYVSSEFRGGSRIPCKRGRRPSRGTPTYNFVKFSEKLHEIEKILSRGGGGGGMAPIPKSATGIVRLNCKVKADLEI